MKKITIDVPNSIEVIIADVYVKVDIHLREMHPIKTTNGKIAFESLQNNLKQPSYKLADEIMNEIEQTPPEERGLE